MRISDWSSDVCSSDLRRRGRLTGCHFIHSLGFNPRQGIASAILCWRNPMSHSKKPFVRGYDGLSVQRLLAISYDDDCPLSYLPLHVRSEEHTSELQSLMRISYAVFCLKKKTTINLAYISSV